MENALLQSSENGEATTNDVATENKTAKVYSKKTIIHQSTLLAIGAVGIFASYSGVSSLQSTLNFEESIGTTSLALCFASTIVTNATIASIVLDRAGAKAILIFSEVTFVLFTLANIYPGKFNLVVILCQVQHSLIREYTVFQPNLLFIRQLSCSGLVKHLFGQL